MPKNNCIKLNINEKDNNETFPLLWAIRNNNNDIIKLLMDYANDNSIKFHINEKNSYGWYPLLLATHNNNVINKIINGL